MERIQKTITLPFDVIERIEKYQQKKYITSFTMAVVQLIIKGLEVEKS